MSSDKENQNEVKASAPLYPDVHIMNEATQQASPPPYYQPLPQYNPAQQPAIVIAPVGVQIQVGSSPARLRCPNCQADIVTQTRHKSGCMTWAVCGSICAIGLFAPCAWLGCQFLPFCIDSCKDVQHNCPNCRAYIGTFDRMK